MRARRLSARPVRETKFANVRFGTVTQEGSFSGYAAVFDRPDLENDIVARGAFAAALKRRGAPGIRMLFQHDPARPVGRWTAIREDTHGLFVAGRLATAAPHARELLALLRAGAVDGLSIGFNTLRARRDPATGQRTIMEADLWEISIVTFPMQPDARIGPPAAAQKAGPPASVREFETWLTRDAGLTRRDARVVIARGYAHLARMRDAAAGTARPPAEKMMLAARNLQHILAKGDYHAPQASNAAGR